MQNPIRPEVTDNDDAVRQDIEGNENDIVKEPESEKAKG